MSILVKKASSFEMEISKIAADKSISHRGVIFSLLTEGENRIENFLLAEDTLNTLKIASKLGAVINKKDSSLTIANSFINEPEDVLDCGNSGTSIRIYAGLLAGCNGFFVLTGDKYLRKRPMKRIVEPLKKIGAAIDGRKNGSLAPLAIRGKRLHSFNYESVISSAQVKSAMILAALKADGNSFYKEPFLSRDHTERMLVAMGAQIKTTNRLKNNLISIVSLRKPLRPLKITVPNDPSSGFFFAVAAAIVPKSRVLLKDVSLNQTRIEAYKVLQKMGADIKFILKENIYEPIGDIEICHKELNAIVVEENIPWLIDELPALAIAMAFAKGKSIVRNAKELRVKESDRIKSVVDNLKKCSVKAVELEDGYEITGGGFRSAEIDSFGDHRIAMSFAIAGLIEEIKIKDEACINTSFPNFIAILKKITKVINED
jgi:3-phosphoshikimate 1-carboxyvinyltransferase